MQATTQTRPSLSPANFEVLDQMGQLYGSMKRKLYARVAA